MFDWIFKRNQRPDLAELKKMVEQPEKKVSSPKEERIQLYTDLQLSVDVYFDKIKTENEQKMKDTTKETAKKIKNIIQEEIDTAMKAHDQQNVLIVLGRIEGKIKEVVGNGREN